MTTSPRRRAPPGPGLGPHGNDSTSVARSRRRQRRLSARIAGSRTSTTETAHPRRPPSASTRRPSRASPARSRPGTPLSFRISILTYDCLESAGLGRVGGRPRRTRIAVPRVPVRVVVLERLDDLLDQEVADDVLLREVAELDPFDLAKD